MLKPKEPKSKLPPGFASREFYSMSFGVWLIQMSQNLTQPEYACSPSCTKLYGHGELPGLGQPEPELTKSKPAKSKPAYSCTKKLKPKPPAIKITDQFYKTHR